jgi:CubicO group peptidase (beta-lactamase class C family)
VAFLDGGAIHFRGYGMADVASGRPVGPATRFQAASVSKSLTALVVARIAERGAIDLAAPVGTVLPDLSIPHGAFSMKEVTIARLLDHTAGTNVPGYRGFPPGERVQTLAQSIAGAADAGGTALAVTHAPGAAFHYSGGGYALLERVVEKITGGPFATAAQELALGPLDMGSSTFDPAATRDGTLATLYDAKGEPVAPHRFAVAAAAGLVTTAPDLARSLRGLMRSWQGADDAFLSRSLARRLLTPGPSSRNSVVFADERWGLGYGLTRTGKGALLAFHPGDNPPGWHALVAALPAQESGIAILTNAPGGRALRIVLACLWLEHQGAGTVKDCAEPESAPGAQ